MNHCTDPLKESINALQEILENLMKIQEDITNKTFENEIAEKDSVCPTEPVNGTPEDGTDCKDYKDNTKCPDSPWYCMPPAKSRNSDCDDEIDNESYEDCEEQDSGSDNDPNNCNERYDPCNDSNKPKSTQSKADDCGNKSNNNQKSPDDCGNKSNNNQKSPDDCFNKSNNNQKSPDDCFNNSNSNQKSPDGYQRIIAVRENCDGSVSKIYALRKNIKPPIPGQKNNDNISDDESCERNSSSSFRAQNKKSCDCKQPPLQKSSTSNSKYPNSSHGRRSSSPPPTSVSKYTCSTEPTYNGKNSKRSDSPQPTDNCINSSPPPSTRNSRCCDSPQPTGNSKNPYSTPSRRSVSPQPTDNCNNSSAPQATGTCKSCSSPPPPTRNSRSSGSPQRTGNCKSSSTSPPMCNEKSSNLPQSPSSKKNSNLKQPHQQTFINNVHRDLCDPNNPFNHLHTFIATERKRLESVCDGGEKLLSSIEKECNSSTSVNRNREKGPKCCSDDKNRRSKRDNSNDSNCPNNENDERKLKKKNENEQCHPKPKKMVSRIQNPLTEEEATKLLNEMVDTAIKGFDKISKALQFYCEGTAPNNHISGFHCSELDKLVKQQAETEHKITCLKNNVHEMMVNMSLLLKSKVCVPEFQEMAKELKDPKKCKKK